MNENHVKFSFNAKKGRDSCIYKLVHLTATSPVLINVVLSSNPERFRNNQQVRPYAGNGIFRICFRRAWLATAVTRYAQNCVRVYR